MKGDPKINLTLNLCLRDQLTAINQFFLHARMAKNWGLNAINEKDYKCSIKAMKMADDLIERVLFLEGLPNLQDLGKLLIGEDIPELLTCDLKMQQAIRTNLLSAVEQCEQAGDYISRELLAEILEEAEEHIDWLETQQWQLDNVGTENYLQSQL